MRIPVVATVLTILGVAVLCTLGTWQLQRLEWKTELLTTLAAEYEKDASQYQFPLESLNSENEDFQYKRGTISGAFNYNKEILLRPRTYESKPGYHSYVPFFTPEGITILVNRGYVPLDWPGIEQPDYVPLTTLTGMLRRPGKPNPFTPENTAEKDEWYRVDLPAIAEAKGLNNLAPYILYEEGENAPGTYPIRQNVGVHLNNNHLQYALFWFFLAAAMTGVYVLRFFLLPNQK